MVGIHATEDRALALAIAPLLHGPRSASSLSRALAIVSERWLRGTPIFLAQCTGTRARIDERDRSRLGHARLGDDALLGSSVHDPGARATITVGPLDAAQLRVLAGDDSAMHALASVLRWFASPTVTIDVVVVVAETQAALGRSSLGHAALGARIAHRVRPLDPRATSAARARETLTRHAAACEEPSDAPRSPSARQEAHTDCAPSPRERRHERRSVAAW
jgi:predicted component of type VI protein secretion system